MYTQTSFLQRLVAHNPAGARLRSHAIGWTALGFMIFGNAMYSPLSKQLTGALSPYSLIFISEICMLTFLLLWHGVQPLVKSFLHIRHEHFPVLLSTALLSGVIGPILWFWGLHETTATNATLFSRIEFVFLLILSYAVLHEKVTKLHGIAALITMIGIGFVATEGGVQSVDFSRGAVLTILSRSSFALGIILMKKELHDVPSELLMLSRSILALCFIFFLAPFIGLNLTQEFFNLPHELISVIIIFSIGARFFGIMGRYTAVEHLSLSVVSFTIPIVTIAAIASAHFYLNEPIYWYHFVGGGFIVLGGTLAACARNKHLEYKRLKRHLRLHMHHH